MSDSELEDRVNNLEERQLRLDEMLDDVIRAKIEYDDESIFFHTHDKEIIELKKIQKNLVNQLNELKEQFMEFIKFRTMNDQKPMINELKKVVAGYHGNILKIMDDNDELKEWVENWCSSVIKEHNELKDTVESVKKLNQYRDKRINETIKDIFELKEQYSALMIEWKTTEEAYGQLHEQIDELKELMRSNDNHRGQEITNLEGVLRELIMITTQGNNYKRLIEKLGSSELPQINITIEDRLPQAEYTDSEKKACDHFFVTIKDNKEGCTFCGIIKDSEKKERSEMDWNLAIGKSKE